MTRHLIGVSILTMFIAAASVSVMAGDGLSAGLRKIADKDTVCNVWVFFKDRPAHSNARRVSGEAALRRQRADFKDADSDRPVDRRYISEVERLGGEFRREFNWGNAASFSVHSSRLSEIASLPFVKSVSPVAVFVRKDGGGSNLGKSAGTASFDGGYLWHTDMVNIPLAHEYLKKKKLGPPGNGVLMAFFDSGFRLDHPAFSRVRDSGSVIAAYDFVDGDTAVYDHDSIARNPSHAYYGSDRHGTQTLGTVAGYWPGTYIGAAWGANFALARTEDSEIESRVEEDNWAAAVLWADSLGAHIISSSLGYRDGFDDSTSNYTYANMDGKTAVVSIAAAGAVERGMIVVTSMGNEGSAIAGSLTAPADVDGVVSVGAVDRNRGIASFSSTGPTADGRVKPELVAPGVGVPAPEPYPLGSNSYTGVNGTSFSAPIVSGVVALILQANPGITADDAKERLYRSCAFSPRQTFVDNRYGNGIPNALSAMMGENEIFLKITDSTGKALSGAQVIYGANAYDVDTSGLILIDAQTPALPATLKIIFRNNEVYTRSISSLPFAMAITVDANRDDGLKVSPNIVRRNRVVRGKYLFSGLDVSTPAIVSVVTLDGKRLWNQKLDVQPDGTAEFVWDRRDGKRKIPAGVYFITVKHGYNMIGERILITE